MSTETPVSNTSVVLYTSPGCPDCGAMRNYLNEHQINFEERSVATPGVADEAKSRYGIRIAPITVIAGNALWGTFAEQKPKLDALFGKTETL